MKLVEWKLNIVTRCGFKLSQLQKGLIITFCFVDVVHNIQNIQTFLESAL